MSAKPPAAANLVLDRLTFSLLQWLRAGLNMPCPNPKVKFIMNPLNILNRMITASLLVPPPQLPPPSCCDLASIHRHIRGDLHV